MYVGPGSGQGQLPRMMYRLRDFRKSSCRAVPAAPYVGCRACRLKGFARKLAALLRELLYFRRQGLDAVCNLQQGAVIRRACRD